MENLQCIILKQLKIFMHFVLRTSIWSVEIQK